MRRSLFTAASSSRRPTNPRIEADERTAADVRELLSAWSAVLAWIDAAPLRNDQ
ncbi:MAG TPA: hypothetical protein VH643_12010 [Gemmataceae bacterium]|jgi:hypothetical protein